MLFRLLEIKLKKRKFLLLKVKMLVLGSKVLTGELKLSRASTVYLSK